MRNVVLACALVLAGCSSVPDTPASASSEELRRLTNLEVVSTLSGSVLCFRPQLTGTCQSIGVPQSVTETEIYTREFAFFRIESVVELVGSRPEDAAYAGLRGALAERLADGDFLYIKFMEPVHGVYDARRNRWCSAPSSVLLERTEFWFSHTADVNTAGDQRLTPDMERRLRAFMASLFTDQALDPDEAAVNAAVSGDGQLCFAYWGVERDGRVTLTRTTMETATGDVLSAMDNTLIVVPADSLITLRAQ
jgi:hypothetical protein